MTTASTSKKYFITFICILFINNSCIDIYNPPIPSQDSHNITVFGQITDNDGYQTVSISTSGSIIFVYTPNIEPVSGCKVILLDNLGNSYNYEEFKPGLYRVWMTKDFLKPGTSYKLKITTSSNEEIESEYDQLQECPEVDSVYYIRQDIPTSNPDKPIQGIQFYIDLDAKGINCDYYKWEIEETWEHHAVYPKRLYWDGHSIVEVETDYSMKICWTTEMLKSFFTLSTKNLDRNRIITQPLHFVDNQTERLTYGYSIKVNQYALSSLTYLYWEQMKANNDLGGLYGKQPINVKGNLKNITFPRKKVLGIFQAASVRSKRYFIKNIKDLDRYYFQCEPTPVNPAKLRNWPGPIYLITMGAGIGMLNTECVDCTASGGTTIKPAFWPY